MKYLTRILFITSMFLLLHDIVSAADPIREIQNNAVLHNRSPVLHWGYNPDNYSTWTSHSLRLVPVYTFGTKGSGSGIDLKSYTKENSPYRSSDALRQIYGYLPENSLNPQAEYLDNTNIADMQQAALSAGKKHIFLVIFDGMDWQTTQAAALYYSGKVYKKGRGHGLHFLDYIAGDTTQYGFAVTAPHNEETETNVNNQTVLNPGGRLRSGYNSTKGGLNPWSPGNDNKYIIGNKGNGFGEHAYPDSANTAMAMTSGVKSYKKALNVDHLGGQVSTIAHDAQQEGYAIGIVTSVPLSHATPAAAYAHNVSRHDYQDLARDLLGQASISHPHQPLTGMDVVIGGGYGFPAKDKDVDRQGANFIPGTAYITSETISKANVKNGGQYTVAVRTLGQNGHESLNRAAEEARRKGTRLLGVYGVGKYEGHLPYQTANGDYQPANGKKDIAEQYTPADLYENPTLAEMTASAIKVLSADKEGFWMMVEAGDVDWANHDTNLDNSIGAVKSGDDAIKVITDWVEQNSNWNESILIVTADHGHYLNLDQPEVIAAAKANEKKSQHKQTNASSGP
ncbi:alkaline phosphatase [Gimesia aquarii]|uniref:Alkaline phosphatase 3 n=1 Tax=Gimesia aquarii TaxID=2527964 RepID=A0A517W4L7_9PLAN|nr:alkaline phosphatase [Gimesia aquarii]QDU00203.1 Alkaline phosphatase 3 precursor [Gimesia aquarii]